MPSAAHTRSCVPRMNPLRGARCPAGSARTSPSVSSRRRDDPTAPCARRFACERGTSTRTRFEGTPPARSDARGRRRRPAAGRRPRARQSSRGTPTPKRERERGRGRQPPATRLGVLRVPTRSPPRPRANRGRARRRARRRRRRRRRRRNREPPRGPPPPTTTTTKKMTQSPRPHAPGTLKGHFGVPRVPRVCRRLKRGTRALWRLSPRSACAKASGIYA